VRVNGLPESLCEHVLAHTLLASVCGLPACSIPAGTNADGLPVGVQVIGPPGQDERVLDVAGVLHGLLGPAATAAGRRVTAAPPRTGGSAVPRAGSYPVRGRRATGSSRMERRDAGGFHHQA